MRTYLIGSESLFYIGLKYSFEKVSNFVVAQIFWDRRKFTSLNFPEKVSLKFSEKRKFAHKHNIETNTDGPNIGRIRRI